MENRLAGILKKHKQSTKEVKIANCCDQQTADGLCILGVSNIGSFSLVYPNIPHNET